MFVVVRSLDDPSLGSAVRYRITVSPAIIGSADGCDVRVSDPHVAPQHVRVVFDAERIVIDPIGGPTWLEDEQLRVPTEILDGVDIQIGHTLLRFRRPDAEEWDDEPTPVHRTRWPAATGVPPARRERRDIITDDAVEQALLATLREKPSDPESRMVYRDWLYDHGDQVRAAFVRAGVYGDRQRDQLLRETEDDWRAITSCAPIEGCWLPHCPGRWNELMASDDDFMRRCGTCRRSVYYCTRPNTIRDAIASGALAVADISLDRREVEQALRGGR